jgi:transcriptional regulator with XRE-family HTH domain
MTRTPAPPDETVGQRIFRLRTERGLTTRELGGPGCSHAHISRIERGQRDPSVKALRYLARRLRVSVEYLETGRDHRAQDTLEMRVANAELELRFRSDPGSFESTFRAIYRQAAALGATQTALRARIGLGFAAAAAGHHVEAAAQLERVVKQLSPMTHPDVYITLARSLAAQGAFPEAIELLTAGLKDLRGQRPLNTAAYVRFATQLSYALDDANEPDEAIRVLRDATTRAARNTDPYSQVRLYWGQARVLAPREPAAALRFIRRAVTLLEATEDTLQLARAQLMSGTLLLAQGNLADAATALGLAERTILESGETQDRAWLRAEQGKLAARTGDPDTAVAYARQALDLLDTDDPAERGRALWALAEGLAGQGDDQGAEAAFADAAQLLALEHREEPVLAARAKFRRSRARGGTLQP